MDFQHDDGGRAAAGFTGSAGDCVVRAIAIASGLPYREVYDALSEGSRNERRGKHAKTRKASARDGVHTKRKWFNDYMEKIGFRWVPTMKIGSGCKVHLHADELPNGRLVVNVSKHLTAVIDGVIHDTYNPDRDGTRCVYGFYIFELPWERNLPPVDEPTPAPIEFHVQQKPVVKRTPHNRFGRGGCFTCEECGKLTRETGQQSVGMKMCAACIEHGEALNSHMDNDHQSDPQPSCPICKEYGIV